MTLFPPVIRDDLPQLAERVTDLSETLQRQTVLITGASGFLGGYLADSLCHLNDIQPVHRRCRILLLARSAEAATRRLGHLRERSDVRFLVQDVALPIPQDERLQFVVHAASAASPKAYLNDPVGTLDANLLATRRLLERAARDGAQSFVYLSSSEVYGQVDAAAIPTPETYAGRVDPTHPRACYVEAKRAGEAYCLAYFRQHGLGVRIVRPFHFHGPGLRLDDGRIVTELIRMGISGKPLELLSDGKATRTYGYALDAAAGILQVLLHAPAGEAYNLGADAGEMSIHKLATIIAGLFGQKTPVKVGLDPDAREVHGSPDRACPDLRKIRSAVGYSPRVPLADGLARTIAWFRHEQTVRPS